MDKHEEKFEFNERFDHNLIKDHEYDNIRELDNPAPFWLMSLFYITVIFSVIYGAYYFWLGIGASQKQEYNNEVAAANLNLEKNKAASSFDENKITLFTDEENIQAGAQIFATKTCVTCHGPEGGGNAIGPNLSDEYWIHGNKPELLYQVVKNGVPTKGMTPFKGQLTETQIVQVLSFILQKIQKSQPKEAKAPQGDKIGFYSPETLEVADSTKSK
ncbi:MAG: cbb3-type cytochrome c oxidase N-terminal domain-containing protein [Bacteroidales bacterium]